MNSDIEIVFFHIMLIMFSRFNIADNYGVNGTIGSSLGELSVITIIKHSLFVQLIKRHQMRCECFLANQPVKMKKSKAAQRSKGWVGYFYAD